MTAPVAPSVVSVSMLPPTGTWVLRLLRVGWAEASLHVGLRPQPSFRTCPLGAVSLAGCHPSGLVSQGRRRTQQRSRRTLRLLPTRRPPVPGVGWDPDLFEATSPLRSSLPSRPLRAGRFAPARFAPASPFLAGRHGCRHLRPPSAAPGGFVQFERRSCHGATRLGSHWGD